MGAVDERLAELGLVVPEVVPPVAAYVPAVLDGSRVYVSGQVPMVDGVLAESGHVGVGDGFVTPERAKELAAICALNAIAAIRSVVFDLDRVERVVKVVGFVASDPSFTGQPGVVNGASRAVRRGVRRRRGARPVGRRRGGAAAGGAGRGRGHRPRAGLTPGDGG